MRPSHGQITRRAMLARTVHATAAIAAASNLEPLRAEEPSSEGGPAVVWDAHGHLTGVAGTPRERIARLLEIADRVGVDKVIVSLGFSRLHDPPAEQIRRDNDLLLEAIQHSAGRALGFAYLNPKHTQESLRELDRCVRDGPMVGVKLLVAVRCNDACLDPVAERAAELKAPILQHTWLKTTGNLPGESTPGELAELAARHPDTSFIAAHTGGDWERGIRSIRAAQNVCAGTSGSDPTAGMVEMAVRELGPNRVIYGSDFGGRSFASQLAKVHGADVSPEAKRLILGGNIRRLIEPICAAKGITL
ncbi:MAG TPA: amidohydrolase family protein [Thermoguttaceae bacterium]|nr:amidohydrolase family protein [Thermoguttaceae bacterium]